MLFFSLQTKSNDLKYFYKKEKLREKDMNKEDATDCANTLSGYHEFIIYGLIQNNSGDWGSACFLPILIFKSYGQAMTLIGLFLVLKDY